MRTGSSWKFRILGAKFVDFRRLFWIFFENGWLAGWFGGACRTKTYFLLNTVLAHRLCTRIWVVYSSDPTGAPNQNHQKKPPKRPNRWKIRFRRKQKKNAACLKIALPQQKTHSNPNEKHEEENEHLKEHIQAQREKIKMRQKQNPCAKKMSATPRIPPATLSRKNKR